MIHRIWKAERQVDPALATQLIAQQFPALAPVSVEFCGEGYDNVVYRVNGDYLFRFPRRRIAVNFLSTEVELLARLGDLLAVPVPRTLFRGEPSADYDWPFVGYQYLHGTTACRADLTLAERCDLARDLAEFLKTLHQIPVRRAFPRLPGDELGRLDRERRNHTTVERLCFLAEADRSGDAQYLAENFCELDLLAASPSPSVLVHGDLYLRHILVDTETHRLSGIIDWGDCHLGDPVIDLIAVFSAMPPVAQRIFFEIYGDLPVPRRVLGIWRAICHSASLCCYALDTADQPLLRESRYSLANLAQQVANLI